jgi:poly-gamma-glutamate capsule biosynthesis protein CapA/YwtB (metallophosphatase superfamily)
MRTPLFISILILIASGACAKEAAAPEATPIASPVVTSSAAALAVTPSATAASTSVVATATATAVLSASGAPDGASITISAVGDISLARQVVDRMEANGAAYPFALIAPLMTGDIGFANLEGALTERGEPWPKGYNFRTPQRFAPGLLSGHFNVVTLANNHTMDYGVVGLQDTIAALDAAGVKHAGAGLNSVAAWSPTFMDVNGLRVAFIGCALTPNEAGGFDIHAWAAGTGDAPGLAICDADTLRTAISGARAQADFVIVAVHAGTEFANAPNATQRELADAAMRAGADLYLGAHAHVVQPIERRGNQLIAWGLGNFIFDLDDVDLANIPEPRVSLILNVTLTKGRGVTAYAAVPVTLDAEEDRPRPATAAEAAILQSLIEP